MKLISLVSAFILMGCCSQPIQAAPYDHIFIIVLENVGFEAIDDSPDAPYINRVLIPQGTLYTNHYGVAHPSEPNYLALFSGSTQGVTNDDCIGMNGPFDVADLYTRLTISGFSVRGYMESMPSNGSLICVSGLYVQKHNPFPFFEDVPVTAWKVYRGPKMPGPNTPNLVWITPNLIDDMHDGDNISVQVHNGDVWLSENLPPIINFCNANNGLIILTMDEGPILNHIFTVLIGPRIPRNAINPGVFTHYNTIKTITDNFGVKALGNSLGLPGLL